MEKYKPISDEHTHEFNTIREMRQTQEVVEEDSGSSIMGSKDIVNLLKLVPRLLAFIEQHDFATGYVKFQNVWNKPDYNIDNFGSSMMGSKDIRNLLE